MDMVIGVTHCCGEVFPHFGRSPEIALYLVDEDSGTVTKKIVPVGENGHEGIAVLLMNYGADFLLCGGIGGGAINALYSMGIQVFPGCSGSTDAVVKKFLCGELEVVEGPTCNCHEHHHEEGHSCGCHHDEEHSCDCEGEEHECEGDTCSCGCHSN